MFPHLGGKIWGLKTGNKPTKGGLTRFRAGQQLPVVQGHPQLWHVEVNSGCGIPSCLVTLVTDEPWEAHLSCTAQGKDK